MRGREIRAARAKRETGQSDTAQLAQIAEISKNARTTWFGLIFVLLFCGVALLDVQDRDFFEYGAATQLPLLGVEVPVVGFFVTAPLLVLGLYIYLHIYLAKLWLELGAAPPRPNGVDLDRAVFPWLISDAALRLRDDVLERPFGWITSLASWGLGWVFAPVIIGTFWVRSWPYHEEILTLYLGALLLIALWVGWESWVVRWRMMRGLEAVSVVKSAPIFFSLGLMISASGWAVTEGHSLY